MIGILRGGVARFVDDPVGSLMEMRAETPRLRVTSMALVACMLCMVVLDFIWGPLAFPHSLEPGGKRAMPVFGVATVEVVRIFGVAAVVWLGMRLALNRTVRFSEACWMTVPYALALVGFEVIQASTWLLYRLSTLDLYGPMFAIGFGAAILVLTVSVRSLAPERDWLTCLPLVAAAFFIGTFYPVPALVLTAGLLGVDRIRGLQ